MKTKLLQHDPNIVVHLHDVHLLLKRLKVSHPQNREVEECIELVNEVDATMSRPSFRLRLITKYDAIWAAFNRIRHRLCTVLPPADLLALVEETRASVGYLDSKGQADCGRKLDAVAASLRQFTMPSQTPGTTGHPPAVPLEAVRFDLQQLSRHVADAREGHWRKVNLLRWRLLLTAGILLVLVISCIWLLPFLFEDGNVSGVEVLCVIVFGALGGLVSALRSRESLKSPSPLFYIERTLVLLKPVVGAGVAVAIYLVQMSRILSLVPAHANATAAYLVLAFVSGFSERFFVNKIQEIVEPKEPSDKKKGDAAKEEK